VSGDYTPVMRHYIGLGLLGVLLAGPHSGSAQAPTEGARSAAVRGPDRLSSAGVLRASARVDSVYVARINRQAFVDAGDFASYLIARLGVRPFPDNLAINVGVDTGAVTLSSQVQQLPPAVKASLGPALMFLDPSSVIAADVALFKNQPGVMRFHLRSLLVNGVAMPEALLSPLMSQVGARYPALTQTGRDILISIPQDGTMRLENGGVRVAISTPAPQPKSKS
jgi:hypothetical protein